jgi:hypothetical protein
LNQHRIDLDSDYAGASSEQMGGEGASAGPNLDYDAGWRWARGFCYAFEDFFSCEEMLA